MEALKKLQLWMDPVHREGPEAMAVDEWLLDTADLPVLRVYDWAGNWASLGYFSRIAAAREAFPGVCWVRRWTGGGVVDHRADWTYSLVVPLGESLARLRGAESYRFIHAALAATLAAEGISTRLSGRTEETAATLCFENPVTHDLVGENGRKLAGAGQRRSRQGLLHQGSVAIDCGKGAASRLRAEQFAARISVCWEHFCYRPEAADLDRRVAARYERNDWTTRR